MKKIMSTLASLLIFTGMIAQNKIVVKNTANFDRKAELVEVTITKQHNLLSSKAFVLKNEKGIEIDYQLTHNKNKEIVSIIFQADVNAKSKTSYSITAGKPKAAKHLTYARFVPERKDDFAWENDLAAYRMYGPALANENPSNGVDLWLKRTSDTIINKRFRDELTNGLSYHIDRGNGLDCYKVGHTLGSGGIAPFQDGKLWVGNHYDRFKVLENGPLRTTFILYYDALKVGNETINQEIKITTMAGSPLNKATVTYSSTKSPFQLAAGIYTHDDKGTKHSNIKTGVIAYAEDAMQDAKTAVGRNYVAVIFNNAQSVIEQDNHLLLTSNYKSGQTFSYYFGGGWSKWQYPTDKDWFDTMEKFSQKLKQPLKVKIK